MQANSTSWTSGDTTVASVNSGGFTSFVGAGSAIVTGNFPSYYYQYAAPLYSVCTRYSQNFAATGAVTVNPPDHVAVVVDSEGFPNQCPTTGVYVRQMNMQLVDIGGNTLKTNFSVMETYTNITANTCNTGTPVATGCAATASGQFLDSMTVNKNYCNPGVLPASGCGFSLTSTWSMCGSGLTKSVWTSSRVTKSNGISVNGNTAIYTPGTQLH